MSRNYYSRRHYERLSNGAPDTPEQAKQRIRYRAAVEQAHKEAMEKFPLPWDNPLKVIEWQAARVEELMR